MGLKAPNQSTKHDEDLGKMNKTIALYTALAILAGFTIMMLPRALETGLTPFTPGATFTNDMREAPTPDGNILQLASKPTNLIPASLVFFAGLAAAIGAYATLKKKSS